MTSMAGPNFGLDLVIDSEQSKYMKEGATQSAGARVVVQSSSAHPQPDEMGSLLNPNTLTALAMHEVLSFLKLLDFSGMNCPSSLPLNTDYCHPL